MVQHKKKFDFEQLLQQHQLKRTAPRLRVLSMMSSRTSATSQPDLEEAMSDIDRVTLYRILTVFEEKGIIHKVFDLNGTANYAMCAADCNEDHHHDEHLHFSCTNCKNVYCLEELHMPELHVPEGFKTEGVTVYATGLCSKCNKRTPGK